MRILLAAGAVGILLVLMLGPSWAAAQTSAEKPAETTPAPAPSKFRSADDGWLDVSGFLDEKYGFLPIAIPITEPAVGYGASVGLMFLSSPLGEARDGFGRPDISLAGGLGTDNGSWGLMLGDIRHWFGDRLETQAGILHLSANLDFRGIGKDAFLERHPIQYNIEPTGGFARVKYRLGDSTFWVGLGYAFAVTRVTFNVGEGTPGLPDIKRETSVGGLTPSFTYDTRDNPFTPLRGTFVEAVLGVFSPALGADDDFQRLQVTAIHYFPLPHNLYLGLRGDGTATFGDTPFYLKPFIALRGAPIMRYQGDEAASVEAELRWQFWRRFSVLSFVGAGAAWNDAERVNNTQKIITGGFGFRYEIARKYGIHMGLDIAFAPDNAAVYVQVGSAWARP